MGRFEIQKLYTLSDPISSAALPLLDGLARRNLARRGVEQQVVHIGGAAINYYHKGPARADQANIPIVLLHGLGDNAVTWSLVLAPLARDHDIYAVDLPGYGFSSRPTEHTDAPLYQIRDLLAAFLREVVGRPALIVGNSLGGWLAVKLARAAPAAVCGVVLLDPGGAPLEGRSSWATFLDVIAVPDLKTARLVFRQMFGAIPPPLLYLGQRGLQELFQRQVVREFVATVQDEEFISLDDLHSLPVPAALIWGQSDAFLPRGSLEFFRENLPGAPVLVLKHCGHLPQRERPIATLRFIRRFADQLAAPDYRRTDWSQSRNTATTVGSQ